MVFPAGREGLSLCSVLFIDEQPFQERAIVNAERQDKLLGDSLKCLLENGFVISTDVIPG